MLIYPYTKEKTVSVPRRGEIMRDETKMDVYTSGVTGAEYDAGMKQLMSNKEIIVPIPVSYTHLDVYKRQVIMDAGL